MRAAHILPENQNRDFDIPASQSGSPQDFHELAKVPAAPNFDSTRGRDLDKRNIVDNALDITARHLGNNVSYLAFFHLHKKELFGECAIQPRATLADSGKFAPVDTVRLAKR